MADRSMWFVGSQKRHDEPFGWWGYRAGPPAPLSIIELIERGSLDARLAAFLWLVIERRASLAVAATLPEAGKTTTLTALLDFLPPDVETIYLRGWYERFEFLETTAPASTYLLCNEISSHLPTYLWGRGVRRLFEAMRAGYGAATTIHANGAAEIIDLLTAFPLEVPIALLGALDLVLTLSVGLGPTGMTRRVVRLEIINERAGQPAPERIAWRDGLLGQLRSRTGRLIAILRDRFALEEAEAIAELARRERYLDGLRRNGVRSVPAVREAILRLPRGGS